jgi:hypothetical protein
MLGVFGSIFFLEFQISGFRELLKNKFFQNFYIGFRRFKKLKYLVFVRQTIYGSIFFWNLGFQKL